MGNQFWAVSLVLAMLAAAGCGGPSGAFTSQLGAQGIGVDDSATAVATDRGGHVLVTGNTLGSFPGLHNAGGADVVVIQFDNDGVPRWTRELGTAGAEHAAGIATDSVGNVYVAGYTDGSFPGFTNAGMEDVFVTKFDGTGAMQWTRQLGTTGHDWAAAIATDSVGNVYVVGGTDGSFPGFTNAGQGDAVIVKLDSEGVQQWVQQSGSQEWESASGVATESGGSVYVVGSKHRNPWYGDDDLDSMVIKYDSSGAQQWIHLEPFRGRPTGVAADSSGNIFVTGGHTIGGGHVLTISKLDRDGAFLWERSTDKVWDHGDTSASGVATDEDGNVYVAGDTTDRLPGATSAGGVDMLVIKFDGGGTQQWIAQYGTSGTEFTYGVAADGSGHVFVAGSTMPKGFTMGGTDLFLMGFDSSGNPRL